MLVRTASSIARSSLHRRQHPPKSPSGVPRLASTHSRHPYPFPSCKNPTPHEIFHLPPSASQDEIKARYYELVKVYHPDAARGQPDVPPSVHNSRFRAVTHAYGALRGRPPRSSRGGAWDYYESRDEAIRAELRRRSRRSGPASPSTAAAADPYDAHLRYTLTIFLLIGMIAAVNSISSHLDRVERHSQSAAANLAQARAEAQVHGMERRKKIRERVRGFHEANRSVNESNRSDTQDVSDV